MVSTMAITFIRHGVTKWNKEKRYAGWTNVPLLDGVEKRDHSPNLLFSSDLNRCVETAELLFPNSPISKLSELRELHFGDWEGMTYEQLKSDSVYQQWLKNPECINPPGGESWDAFTVRLEHGWKEVKEEIINSGASTITIITHGGPIHYFLSRFSPEPSEFWEWRVQPLQGYTLYFTENQLEGEERCTLLQEELLTERKSGSKPG